MRIYIYIRINVNVHAYLGALRASTMLQDLQDLHFYKYAKLQQIRIYKSRTKSSTAWWPARGRRIAEPGFA